jgi:NTP pyrophosphatase (non-canonical NTP hydrolase)
MYGDEPSWTDSEWKKEISDLFADQQEGKDKEETLGKVLFELCRLAQKQQIDAEQCLSEYVKNYIKNK